MGINLGVIDGQKEEFIKESFYIKDGDYGMGVPYYIYLKDSKAIHLEQKLYNSRQIIEALQAAINEGKGHEVEFRKPPHN